MSHKQTWQMGTATQNHLEPERDAQIIHFRLVPLLLVMSWQRASSLPSFAGHPMYFSDRSGNALQQLHMAATYGNKQL